MIIYDPGKFAATFYHFFIIFDQCQKIRFEHDPESYRNFMNPKKTKSLFAERLNFKLFGDDGNPTKYEQVEKSVFQVRHSPQKWNSTATCIMRI